MTYVIKDINIKGFRSYKEGKIELDPNLTIIYGLNAAGKTNIIEALQLLTSGKSFRSSKRTDFINWECDKSSLEMTAFDNNLKKNVSINIYPEKRDVYINGKYVRSLHDLSSNIPSVIFIPDDLKIIKESSHRRRQEIDNLGIQLSSTYSRLLSEYKKIIIQRNKLLKDEQYGSQIFYAWTERMVEVGIALINKRISLFNNLYEPLISLYKEISSGSNKEQNLDLIYKYSWGTSQNYESIIEKIKEKEFEERSRRQSLIGPHCDDLIFEINSKSARSFASQGQQRSIAIAWKLAQLLVIERISHKKPLLLLDDIMSEFDKDRRHYLLNVIDNFAQTVITTANIDYFEQDVIEKSKVLLIPDDIQILR